MASTSQQIAPPEAVYDRLPEETKQKCPAVQAAKAEGSSKNFVTAFLSNRLPQDKRQELDNEMKKTFSLEKNKGSKFRGQGKHRVRRKQLSAQEKRRLGLYKLSRSGFKYDDFRKLHALWKKYMRDYLEIQQLEKLGWTPVPHDKHQDQLYLKLMKADYHGCKLRVTRSKCPSYVGLTGIVMMETKHTFQILGKDNIMRTVPKQNSIFTFCLDTYVYTIYGNQFRVRPSERSVRKMKCRVTIDL